MARRRAPLEGCWPCLLSGAAAGQPRAEPAKERRGVRGLGRIFGRVTERTTHTRK